MSESGLESGLRLVTLEQGVFFGFQALNIAWPQWLCDFGRSDMGSGGPFAYNSTHVLLTWQGGGGDSVPNQVVETRSRY